MKNTNLFSNSQKIHFIGIGGVSMSALARYCAFYGKCVSGSDVCANEFTKSLINNGISVYDNHSKENVGGADLVVYSSAVKLDNPELKFAVDNGVKVIARSKLLGDIIKDYKNSVAVAGSHGKTTTTAMIANVLILADKDPTVFLGGEDKQFSNLKIGASNYAVLEACEFSKSMVDIAPKIAVVLNIDNDHLDCYKDMTDMVDTFKKFTSGRINVINADDVYAKRLSDSATITFGINNLANYCAKNLKNNDGAYTFTVYSHSRPCGRIKLKVKGVHNVYNALATIAVCDFLGVGFSKIKKGLVSFDGVKRRNEYIGKFNKVNCYADYAHHPTEILATTSALKESIGKFITVFQPHTYSRTKLLMQDFISVLKDLKPLVIYKTYPAREDFDQQGSAQSLVENINNQGGECVFVDNQERLIEYLNLNNTKSDGIVFLGAGDIYDIAKKVVEKNN